VSEFRCRISRVRMKDGASVTILPTPMTHGDPDQPENWQGKLIQHAKQIAGHSATHSELDGYVVVGLYSDGSTSMGIRLPDRIPRALMPAYVSELIRREIIVEPEAERVFDDHFQRVE
jgi:hypothetical protein